MGVQPGFFDTEARLRELSEAGDPLERLTAVIDFEVFRGDLDAALRRSDRRKGGRPPLPHGSQRHNPRENAVLRGAQLSLTRPGQTSFFDMKPGDIVPAIKISNSVQVWSESRSDSTAPLSAGGRLQALPFRDHIESNRPCKDLSNENICATPSAAS